MKKVYSHESIVTINHLRNLLEAQGIRAMVRNDRLFGVLGEVPFMECWPQLWVLDDLQASYAEQVLQEAMTAPDSEAPEWRCPACGERVDGQFAVCWNCGAAHPDDPSEQEPQ